MPNCSTPRGRPRADDSRSPPRRAACGKQTWHFPSRAECTLCHTMPAKYVLGVNTLQMNKDHDYGNGVDGQSTADAGAPGRLQEAACPSRPKNCRTLVDYRDESLPLEARARSYLHANCAHCHMQVGRRQRRVPVAGDAAARPNWESSTPAPARGCSTSTTRRYSFPGNPDRSMIYHRMTKLGLGRMPHVASNVIDEKAVEDARRVDPPVAQGSVIGMSGFLNGIDDDLASLEREGLVRRRRPGDVASGRALPRRRPRADQFCVERLSQSGARSAGDRRGAASFDRGRSRGDGQRPHLRSQPLARRCWKSAWPGSSGSRRRFLFPTGFAANVGTIRALAGKDDVVFSDRLNHASLIDGCRLSQARVRIYRSRRSGRACRTNLQRSARRPGGG